MRILVFWDSISEWFWDYENWGWVNMLKVNLWKQYWYEKMVMNYWVAAYTSENIVNIFQSYFDWCSRREVWKEKDSTVIIGIWINDCSINNITNQPRINKEEFTKNITKIIGKCKNDELINRIIFITNINIYEKVVNNYEEWNFLFFNEKIEKYNTIIKNLCIQNNIESIDLYWIMNKDDLEDWLHPNTKWHTKIFKKVEQYLINK